MTTRFPHRLVVALTGASGSIYGIRLIREMVRHPVAVHVIVSTMGRLVLAHELGREGDVLRILKTDPDFRPHPDSRIVQHPCDTFFAPPASGSFRHDGMAVVPCSMKTAAAIASGLADNLIHRAADICLKERRRLVLVPRETPFSTIHLQNLLRLSEAGAVILPPSPGFYHQPASVDDLVHFVVARILDQFQLPHALLGEWGDPDA